VDKKINASHVNSGRRRVKHRNAAMTHPYVAFCTHVDKKINANPFGQGWMFGYFDSAFVLVKPTDLDWMFAMLKAPLKADVDWMVAVPEATLKTDLDWMVAIPKSAPKRDLDWVVPMLKATPKADLTLHWMEATLRAGFAC
jgi:hypothetical protein